MKLMMALQQLSETPFSLLRGEWSSILNCGSEWGHLTRNQRQNRNRIERQE